MNSNGGGIGLLGTLIYLAVIVVTVAGMWKSYTKAGKYGWACIVPIYNIIVLLEIVKKPIWWIILFFVPIVNIIVIILIYIEFAKKFGKGGGFAVLLLLLPFIGFPIIGFSEDVKYVG